MTKAYTTFPLLLGLATTLPTTVFAQTAEDNGNSAADSTAHVSLQETAVRAKRRGLYRSFDNVENEQVITLHELTRAACCNLGESFVTNPSVDVDYSDAATGARQIRLLGLAGTYVQMLNENLPALRIAARPYGLSHIPGPWLQSIQVSKGASSVKNGYEAITGQINMELKKPHQPFPNYLAINGYADMRGRIEANAETTLKPSENWGTTLLAHYDKNTTAHDDNHDGFADMPKVEQLNLTNRWTYNGGKIFSQFGVNGMYETRESGQIVGHRVNALTEVPYLINLNAKRIEAFGKTAYMFEDDHKSNLAVMVQGSLFDQNATYGRKDYGVLQRNAHASLMFETEPATGHSISVGANLQADDLTRDLPTINVARTDGQDFSTHVYEVVPGFYGQYTYTLGDKLTLMGGLRLDHSNLYGTFLTPRAHLKFSPSRAVALRLSVGKGYRTTHLLEENNFYLSSARALQMENEHLREEAWNYGASLNLRLPVADRLLNTNFEFYHTRFLKQAVTDLETPNLVRFYALDGRSYSSVFQAEVSYPFFEGFNLTAAYRFADVKTTYLLPEGPKRMQTPLQSRYKALVTATYATPLERWQFDVTLQLNGGGRLPNSYDLPDGSRAWVDRYKAYPQLSAQITRNFRQWSIYAGGENLTGHKQAHAIIAADRPWSQQFDPTMIYAPLDGAMVYVGFRFTMGR